jgi:2-oxo-4-hydroxy-4-carboxy-5-ureidoimidazoline decarboxylase
MQAKPTLAELNACTAADFARRLDGILEHSADIWGSVAGQRPFANVDALHAALLTHVRALPQAGSIAFLQRHPELGGTAARAGMMTPASVVEQGTLLLRT